MKIEWKTCLKLGVTLLAVVVAYLLLPDAGALLLAALAAAAPLIIGCVIAYPVNILLNAYEKRLFRKPGRIGGKLKRPVCLLLAFMTLFGIVALVVALVVPELAACVQLIAAEIPPAAEAVVNALASWNILTEDVVEHLASFDWQSFDWQSKLEELVGFITSGIGDVLGSVFAIITSVFGGVVTGVIALIFSIYLLGSKERIASQFRRLLQRYANPSVAEKAHYVLHIANDCFRGFIIGQCTEAVILGLLCMLGMLLLGLPYATMIGALIAFTSLIPIAGAYIGAVLGAFMILPVSPLSALLFLVFLVILQQLEGNLIYPRVVGSSIGLPGIWVLAAVTIGGGLMGIPGMLLGVPLAATIYRLLREDVGRHEHALAASAEQNPNS